MGVGGAFALRARFHDSIESAINKSAAIAANKEHTVGQIEDFDTTDTQPHYLVEPFNARHRAHYYAEAQADEMRRRAAEAWEAASRAASEMTLGDNTLGRRASLRMLAAAEVAHSLVTHRADLLLAMLRILEDEHWKAERWTIIQVSLPPVPVPARDPDGQWRHGDAHTPGLSTLAALTATLSRPTSAALGLISVQGLSSAALQQVRRRLANGWMVTADDMGLQVVGRLL